MLCFTETSNKETSTVLLRIFQKTKEHVWFVNNKSFVSHILRHKLMQIHLIFPLVLGITMQIPSPEITVIEKDTD